jgi:hypothetical protein
MIDGCLAAAPRSETGARYSDWGKDVRYWDDEIHPDSTGFEWLVQHAIGPAVARLL